jgi:hypothetical protein
MAKSRRKIAKGIIQAKDYQKTAEGRKKPADYINYLCELHKLQGVLLTELRKRFL